MAKPIQYCKVKKKKRRRKKERKKSLPKINVGEGAEKREPSYAVSGNAK